MSWLYNLCGCITPEFRHKVINYLNSATLANQVVEEEKCTEEKQDQSVYAEAKNKSYNFMKVEQEDSDDEEPSSRYYKRQEQDNQQIIDAFWYPPMKAAKWQHFRQIYQQKKTLLLNILSVPAISSNYDKIYDSQDELALAIFCRIQTLAHGKKVNSYRFSFHLADTNLAQYWEWIESSEKIENLQIEHLLNKAAFLESDPEDQEFVITQRMYKKLLVINPHEFITAIKTQKNRNEEENADAIITTVFSVKEAEVKAAENYSRGWVNLAGLLAKQQGGQLSFYGYLNVELDVSVSPNMLKQPLAKEIRQFVQKLCCSIKKSDEI